LKAAERGQPDKCNQTTTTDEVVKSLVLQTLELIKVFAKYRQGSPALRGPITDL